MLRRVVCPKVAGKAVALTISAKPAHQVPRKLRTPDVIAANVKTCDGCPLALDFNAEETEVHCARGCRSCSGGKPAWVAFATGECNRKQWIDVVN